MNKKTGAFILAVLMAGMLAACGQNEDAKTGEEGIVENEIGRASCRERV